MSFYFSAGGANVSSHKRFLLFLFHCAEVSGGATDADDGDGGGGGGGENGGGRGVGGSNESGGGLGDGGGDVSVGWGGSGGIDEPKTAVARGSFTGSKKKELRRGIAGGMGNSAGSRRSLPVCPNNNNNNNNNNNRRGSSSSAFGNGDRQHTGAGKGMIVWV